MEYPLIYFLILGESTLPENYYVGMWKFPGDLEYLQINLSSEVIWCHIHDYYGVTITEGRLIEDSVTWDESVTYDWETGEKKEKSFKAHFVGHTDKIFMRSDKIVFSAIYEDEYHRFNGNIPKDCLKFL